LQLLHALVKHICMQCSKVAVDLKHMHAYMDITVACALKVFMCVMANLQPIMQLLCLCNCICVAVTLRQCSTYMLLQGVS
jgi:hypothetical protein